MISNSLFKKNNSRDLLPDATYYFWIFVVTLVDHSCASRWFYKKKKKLSNNNRFKKHVINTNKCFFNHIPALAPWLKPYNSFAQHWNLSHPTMQIVFTKSMHNFLIWILSYPIGPGFRWIFQPCRCCPHVHYIIWVTISMQNFKYFEYCEWQFKTNDSPNPILQIIWIYRKFYKKVHKNILSSNVSQLILCLDIFFIVHPWHHLENNINKLLYKTRPEMYTTHRNSDSIINKFNQN